MNLTLLWHRGTNTLNECLLRHGNTVQELKSFPLLLIQILADQTEKSQICILLRVLNGRQNKDFSNDWINF